METWLIILFGVLVLWLICVYLSLKAWMRMIERPAVAFNQFISLNILGVVGYIIFFAPIVSIKVTNSANAPNILPFLYPLVIFLAIHLFIRNARKRTALSKTRFVICGLLALLSVSFGIVSVVSSVLLWMLGHINID